MLLPRDKAGPHQSRDVLGACGPRRGTGAHGSSPAPHARHLPFHWTQTKPSGKHFTGHPDPTEVGWGLWNIHLEGTVLEGNWDTLPRRPRQGQRCPGAQSQPEAWK